MRINSRPTLRDVASAAGTSIATASNVISGKKNKFVSDRLKKKVLEAAERLNYSPTQLARTVHGKRRHVVAVLVPELHNAVLMRMIQGAQKVASDRGYLILICSTLRDPAKEEGYIQSLMQEGVDGFLIAVTLQGTDSVQKLQMLDIPYVVLDRGFPSVFPYDSVSFEDEQAVSLAVRHLYDMGHRQIGYMGYATEDMARRNASFRKACRELKLNEADCPVHLGLLSAGEGERMLNSCAETHSCSAIVIGSHLVGEDVIRALRQKGLSVPDDISVVIVGNPIWTDMAGPGFTAVELPHPEMGSMGMAMLIDRIEGSRSPKRNVKLDCSLIIRSSVRDINGKMDEAE